MPNSDILSCLKSAVNADFKLSKLGNWNAEFALIFILCNWIFIFIIYTVKSAGGLPTSLCLNSATELPNSTQFRNSLADVDADVEFYIFRIFKNYKMCRNSISSITFDIELHF